MTAPGCAEGPLAPRTEAASSVSIAETAAVGSCDFGEDGNRGSMVRRSYTVALMLSIPLVTLLLALAAPSTPAAIEPRDVVRLIAEQIESNYFDPKAATRIAAALTADLEAGEFDSLRDPREL